jgi:hypothetical protein
MSNMIEAVALEAIDVSADGSSLRLGFTDANGEPASLVLPGDCAGQLAMSLPRAVRRALSQKHRDASLRLVFPIGTWTLEMAGDAATFILTMSTCDGFEASYGLDEAKVGDLARSLESAPQRMPQAPVRN